MNPSRPVARPWIGAPCALASGALLLIVALAGCAPPTPTLRGDLLISDVRILDPGGGAAGPPSSLLVTGEEIAWIGARSEEGSVAAARRVDGRGGFLLPGLIDMHAHVRDPRDLVAFLRHGVTTVMNLHGDPSVLELRESVRSGRVAGPQIFTSGPILDGDPGRGGGNVPLGDAAAARAEVAAEVAAGYDAVKIYDLIEEPAYRAAVEAARAAGKPVFGHIPKALGLEGVLGSHDVVAHAEELYYTFFRDTDDRGRLGEAARRTAAAGLAVIPNTGFVRTILDQAEDVEAFLDRDELRFAAPATLADWLPEVNRYVGREPEWVAGLRRMYPFLHELTLELHHSGVALFAGSDAGAVGGIPGASLLREIRELELAGLSRVEALNAATRVPGEWLSRRVGAAPRGRIAVGQRADLVLLERDPIEDLSALASARAVVAAGRWHEIAALEAELRSSAPPVRELVAAYRELRALAMARDFVRVEARLAAGPSAAFAEKAVNAMGYRALYVDRDREVAQRLFEANARAFPASWNVWDSLGEALAETGDAGGAIASYEKSLALAPGNDNARRRLADLRRR